MNYLTWYYVIITGTLFVICFRPSNSQLYEGKYEGDNCELENKEQGKCVRLSQCPSAIEIVQKREHPSTCSYIRFTPIVCCPVQQAIQTRISEQKCRIFQNVKYTTTPEPPTTPFNISSIEVSYVDPNVPPVKLTAELYPDTPVKNVSTADFDYTDVLNENNLVRRPEENNINEISLDTKAKLNNTFNENDKTNINEEIATIFIKINYTEDTSKPVQDPIIGTIYNITQESNQSSIETKPQEPKLQVSEINLQPGTVYEGANNTQPLDFDYDLSAQNDSSSTESIPLDFTIDYSSLTNDDKSIVAGSIAQDNEFPHMAAIGFTSGDAQLWRCGGTLISEKFVLTAAHCLSASEYGPAEWVSLGSNYVNLRENSLYPQQQVYKIIRRISHPKYKRPSSYNDIALVELNQTVEFTRSIRPACLHTSPVIDPQVQLTATGWGLTQFGGDGSESLMKVLLDVYQGEECLKIYEDINGSRRLKNGIMQEEQFCAGGKQGEQDTCQGDSGGPLQLKVDDINGGTYSIIGITSFGKSCGLYGVPGVYTRISQYLPWLESIIWPNEF